MSPEGFIDQFVVVNQKDIISFPPPVHSPLNSELLIFLVCPKELQNINCFHNPR